MIVSIIDVIISLIDVLLILAATPKFICALPRFIDPSFDFIIRRNQATRARSGGRFIQVIKRHLVLLKIFHSIPIFAWIKMKFQWKFAPLNSEFDALLKNKHLNGETPTTDQQKRVEIPVQWRYGYHFRCVPPVGTQQHPLSKMDRILFDFLFWLAAEQRDSTPLACSKRKIKSAAGSSENAPPGGEPKNQQECCWRPRWRQIKELDRFFHTRQWNVSPLFQQNRTEWFSIQSGSIHSGRRLPLRNLIQLEREMGPALHSDFTFIRNDPLTQLEFNPVTEPK